MNSPLHIFHCLWFNPITTTNTTNITNCKTTNSDFTNTVSQQHEQKQAFSPKQQLQQNNVLTEKTSKITITTTRKRRADSQTFSSIKTNSLLCFDDSDENIINKKERLWVCADVDRAVHLDERCLKSLLENEINVQVTEFQIRRQQRQITKNCNDGEKGVDENARTQLVCESEHVDFIILPLAVAFVDRVLASKFLPRRNLQALGASCLLLASKLKAPVPLSAAQIASYCSDENSDVIVMEADSSLDKENSSTTILSNTTIKTTSTIYLTPDELLDWEMLVVNQLKWNLLQSTPFEFFDQMLVRSPVLEALREDFAHCLHKMQKGGEIFFIFLIIFLCHFFLLAHIFYFIRNIIVCST